MRGLALALAALLGAGPASAAGWGLHAQGRSLQLDPQLASYGWQVEGRAAFAAGVTRGLGPVDLGLEFMQAQTRQEVALDGPSPRVGITQLQLVASRSLPLPGQLGLVGRAGLGWWHAGYRPGRASYADPGGGEVIVDFEPVDSLVGTLGLALHRPLVAGLGLEFGGGYAHTRIDTAHRRGDGIVERREGLHHFHLGAGLSWAPGAH